jgi:hypothetical protein
MENKRPLTYRVQNSCITCKHHTVLYRYDGSNEYFCQKDGSDRPLCGCDYSGEGFAETMFKQGVPPRGENMEAHDAAWDKLAEIWGDWAEGHQVEAAGTCGEWEQGSKDEDTD